MSSIIKVNTVQDQDGNNIINENANTITIGASGDTITIPSGATLANNGTATGFASIAWQSSIVTAATHTAAAGQGLWLDTSSNAITLTLPASPSVGDQLIFTDYARNWGTNAVTLNLNSEKFQGNTTPVPVYDTTGESVDIVYSGSTKGWIPNTDGAVALETPQAYSADFLVVAGGAGGGSSVFGGGSGGGGAGGYRTSTQTVIPGNTITVTVGDGGASKAHSQSQNGGAGSSSLISGTGLTTITSAGGGGGGYAVNSGVGANGTSGGSGGGGGGSNAGTTGSTGGAGNTPSTTPSQGNNGGDVTFGNGNGGGGGGSSGVGGAGGVPGNGGAGTANSITGSSVTYARGGDNSSGTGADGAANTGNGGEGAGQENSSGAGGSGVVILSMPDASYSGTTTGSPTVATGVSGKTVLTFNGDGSYTA